MATIVETGSIIANANSYISDANFASYASDRGISVTGTAATLLLNAALYVETLPFLGDKKTREQSMQWPRYDVMLDGFLTPSDVIPQILKDLQCEVALAIDAGNDPLAQVSRAVKKEKVDVIEVEYADNSAPFTYNRKIKALEKKLINSAFTVSRG
tara:strand:- start:904 stop:1371 length:468 start_codon:yes stop_codon:yes gene_type:complete